MSKQNFYSGTSGLVLPVPNKQHYPRSFQDKSRLTYYASLFNSVEINSSFYKIPQAKTVAKWADETGDNFRFTFKLWKGITHNKQLVFNPGDVQHFMAVINHAGNKKGCLLVQLPASIHAERVGQLDELLSQMNKYNTGWQVAVEFRSKNWYTEKVYKVIEKHDATVVIHDMPISATPINLDLSDSIYLRFHGPNGRYGGSYDDGFLAEYAGYISDWLRLGKTVYAYFNNTMGDAVNNLITLNNLLKYRISTDLLS